MNTKKLLHFLMVIAVILTLGVSAQAQSAITFTTISSAMSPTASTMYVASATGFTASSGTQQYVVYVDREAMLVTGVSGTTITVQRGIGGIQSGHSITSYALVGARGSVSAGSVTGGPFVQSTPVGSCTRSSVQTLPVINIRTGEYANCFAGPGTSGYDWYVQTALNLVPTTITRACTPPGMQALGLITTDGNTALPLQLGNNTTPVAGSVYYGTIEVPTTRVVTGLSILNGLVAATDTLVLGLYESGGTLLKFTPVAGTTASGASRFQDIAFAASAIVTGPARYWVAYQASGTTTRFSSLNLTPGLSTAGLGAFTGVLGSSFTGSAGTLPSLTTGGSPATGALPTSLIANVAPLMCAY